MPYVKITYASWNNITVQGTDYIEIDEGELDENGELPPRVLNEYWQAAVNDFMSDTMAEIVQNEGD